MENRIHMTKIRFVVIVLSLMLGGTLSMIFTKMKISTTVAPENNAHSSSTTLPAEPEVQKTSYIGSLYEPTEIYCDRNTFWKYCDLSCDHSDACKSWEYRNVYAAPNATHRCCADDHWKHLLFVDDMTKHFNETWAIYHGTLLGAVRDQDIIPWTNDVDIVTSDGMWNILQDSSKNEKCTVWRKHDHYMLVVTIDMHRMCSVKVDSETNELKILNPEEKKGAAYIDHYGSKDGMGDLQRFIRNKTFPSFTGDVEHLTNTYGCDWTVEDTEKRGGWGRL